jgi:hypothetical protein
MFENANFRSSALGILIRDSLVGITVLGVEHVQEGSGPRHRPLSLGFTVRGQPPIIIN